jgi:adenylate cyclase
MDRIWQWAWDRYAARYSWVIYAVSYPIFLQLYLALSFVVVAYEESDRYIEAAVVTCAAVLVLVYVMVLPGVGRTRLAERWAAGHAVDRVRALEATYAYSRGSVVRVVRASAVWVALLAVVVGVIAGATGWRLVRWGVLGAAAGIATQLIFIHSFTEAALRPARVALAGDTGIGDSLPRSRPSFATWSNISLLSAMFAFAVAAAMLAAARREQLTKTTGDAILLTHQCVDTWILDHRD